MAAPEPSPAMNKDQLQQLKELQDKIRELRGYL
jgi:hypothetical protein